MQNLHGKGLTICLFPHEINPIALYKHADWRYPKNEFVNKITIN